MWPQALQMTRDECRGILRRLELDSYSQVISVFRAQGGLSDSKVKILEELRGIFHISQERHRAEARRVANDEELATIAEAISGPNTWQEWSREGRRCFPMLPRVPPQTALALIANSVACETAADNEKLAFPANTAVAVAEEQAAYAAARSEVAAAAIWDADRSSYVVTSDPFKMPDLPQAVVGSKKNLKRNITDNPTGSSKKRNVSESVSPTKQQQQQQQQKQYQHITANINTSPQQITPPTSNIRKLYHNHNKLQQQQQRYLQQQHQQQQQTKPRATKKNANGAGGVAKRQATPAKSGRRAQKQQEQQLQKQLLQQQHQQQQAEQQLQHAQQQQARNLAYIGNPTATPPTNIIAHFDDEQRDYASTTVAKPQIAASKKDITKNLTKLQIPATVTPLADATAHTHNAITSPNALTSAGATPPPPLHGKATPVQKYIVEDRQPHQQQSPQIMTLPQLSAAATKLRAVNTTILPPGTKLTTTKKLTAAATSADVISSGQPQVFSIIDGTTITTNASNVVAGGAAVNAQSAPLVPTHMPPAVIQLHGGGGGGESPQPPAQGKVLTTKLLPVVLSGTSATAAAGGAQITKISGTIIPAGANVFRKPPNIITSIIGMGTAGAKLSSTFNAVNTSGSGNGGPQIISNVKLTSAMSNTTVATTQQQQQFLQQQLKNVTGIRTSVKICQSPNGKVFIQPANLDAASKAKFVAGGALQHKLLAANTLIGGGGGLGTTISGAGVSTVTTPQRIAIQKVQIIPAPHANSSVGNAAGGTLQKPTTLTLSGVNKSNMIFVPASSTTRIGNTPGTITLAKAGNILQAKSSQATMSGDAAATKPNVVIIGAASTISTQKSPREVIVSATGVTKLSSSATFIDSSSSNSGSSNISVVGSGSNKISEMITEDTPVDILSMPIIVDDGSGGNHTTTTTIGNNIGDTVTVLATTNIIETTPTTTSTSASTMTKQQQSSTVILGATDWEMELDQATAKARSSTQRRSTGSSGGGGGGRKRKSSAMILDEHFEDVIVVEQEDVCEESANDDIAKETQTIEVAGDQVTTSTSDDIIILASSDGKSKEEDETHIEVIDEDQKQSTANTKQKTTTTTESTPVTAEIFTFRMSQEPVECDTDAGFDETIDAEIDENTAIEYIEEEHMATGGEGEGHHEEIVFGNSGLDKKTQSGGGDEEQHDRPTSSTTNSSAVAAAAAAAKAAALEEEDKNNSINCRFSEIISSSGDESDANAFIFAQELEAGTLTNTTTVRTVRNRSQDEQLSG